MVRMLLNVIVSERQILTCTWTLPEGDWAFLESVSVKFFSRVSFENGPTVPLPSFVKIKTSSQDSCILWSVWEFKLNMSPAVIKNAKTQKFGLKDTQLIGSWLEPVHSIALSTSSAVLVRRHWISRVLALSCNKKRSEKMQSVTLVERQLGHEMICLLRSGNSAFLG